MKNLIFLFICILGFSVVGCGTSSNDALVVTATEVVVKSFSIVGTSEPSLPAARRPINAGENEGNFSMSWDIEADGVVRLRVGVNSAGSSVCNLFNRPFSSHCGEGATCALVDTILCNFSSNNILSCERGQTLDLSGFLDELPKDADFCLGARGINDEVTDSGRVGVQFQ